jgi:predicted nucleotidyltransferase
VRTKAPPLLPIFRSDVQARLLAVLLLGPERGLSGPELQRRLGVPEATFRREAARLVRAGVLEVEQVGRTNLYRAATDSPLYEPLRELLERTLGVEEELRRRLGALPGVEIAAIFGSWAEEAVDATSDIDLLVVGAADFETVARETRDVEELAGREIHLFVYAREELERKRAAGHGFVQKMLAGPLKPIVGNVEELR